SSSWHHDWHLTLGRVGTRALLWICGHCRDGACINLLQLGGEPPCGSLASPRSDALWRIRCKTTSTSTSRISPAVSRDVRNQMSSGGESSWQHVIEWQGAFDARGGDSCLACCGAQSCSCQINHDAPRLKSLRMGIHFG